MKGRAILADALTRFADGGGDRRLGSIAARLAAPLSVEVLGRRGVGRRTVAGALRAAGVAVGADRADVAVLVIAEALTAEDLAVLSGPLPPAVVVLNKADLSGAADGGPIARAHTRAAEFRSRTGVPTVPLVGLLASPGLDTEFDGDLVAALHTLLTQPADLRSTDAFLDGAHPLGRDVRRRLLDTLDRFGIAHAVLALGRGDEPATLPGLLRGLSGFDDLLAALDAAAAPLRYRRVRAALTELQALAVQSGDPDDVTGLSEFVAGDDTVLAVMAAAVDVVTAAGLTVDPADDRTAHLRRAVRWRRYGRGPVNTLHRSCAADICRGSLRLLDHRSRAGGDIHRSRPGGDIESGSR